MYYFLGDYYSEYTTPGHVCTQSRKEVFLEWLCVVLPPPPPPPSRNTNLPESRYLRLSRFPPLLDIQEIIIQHPAFYSSEPSSLTNSIIAAKPSHQKFIFPQHQKHNSKMTTNSFGTSPFPKYDYEPVFTRVAARSNGLPMTARVAAVAAATGLG